MRELIYLSDSKLRQFTLDPPRRRWWSRAGLEGEVSVAGLGRVRVTRAAEDARQAQPDLERVIAALAQSDRAALEYTTPGLQPGQWIYFRTRLYQRVFDDEHIGRLVLFLQPADGSPERLLLHGSPEHLTGRARQPPANLTWKVIATGSDRESLEAAARRAAAGWSEAAATLDLQRQVRKLGDALRRSDEKGGPAEVPARINFSDPEDWFSLGLSRILSRLDNVSSTSDPWMGGHARVTAVTYASCDRPPYWAGRLVAATPLYIQFAAPPAE